MSIAKETSESLFETFVRFRDPSEDTTEGSIIELLPPLPGTDHDCLATFQDDKHGDTFLHYACRNGWYEVTKVLIEKYKCDPNCRNKNGSTPLLFAYTSGNQNLVDYLIVQSHCDPLAIDRDGLTRLHYAILGGQLAMVKHLIEEEHCDSGCKTNDSQTPLHLACLYGWLDMVKYLIEKQHCDTCCTTNCSGTPMYFACAGGHLDILRYLIEEQGCDPNCSQNNYILHLACAGGYMHIVMYLIEEQHCNVDCRLADDGSSLLHLASTKGHLNVLKYLIEIKGCDPNCVENTGMTPLHIACKYGWLDITKYLIEDQHCDPNCTNKKNWTPLHLACYNRHMDVVIYFVEERHCDTDCKTSDGRTVLHLVCETGHLEIVNYVIEQQLCDPNCTTNDGWTPMHFASREGKIDLIRYFTNTLNCDSNCKDSNGWTPLHLACFSGDKDIVKYLIEKQHCELDCKTYGLTLVRFVSGTNINKYLKFCLHHMSRKGWMPLHLACYSGNTDIVRHLIEEQHCDLDCRTDDGITPVHIACQYGRLDVAKYLTEEQHCDPNCTTNDGWTPIHFASQEGRIDIVRYFVKSLKFNWNFKNNKGWTPLHLACYHANVDIVKCLLEAQCCNSECRTNDGKGPLYLASEKGYLNVVKYLVEEYHCDTNCKDNYTGMTALHAACFNGSLDVAKYLIEEQHCDPNCKQNTDMTPLHLACVKGHLDVVKYLIEEQHCDPNCKQNTGMTLLHIVCRYGSLDVLKYLIEEQHCGPNSKENTGMTPLHIAYKYGHLDVAKHLIEEWHCDPNCTTKDGWTPMHFVSQDGRIDDVKYLAEQLNCDSNCKDSKGWTPLHLACYNENMDIIKYLVEEQHCDLDGRTYDWTNLIGEHFSDRFKYYELWSEFMNGKDWAPLHLVCYSGNMDIIIYLTEEKKCDLYCRTNDGITPLHLVCFYGHLKVVKYLVERHKCDLLCKNIYGQTPLHYNCRCKVEALDLFQYLVESKCYDVTSKDKSGRTPLHYAAERGHLNICKILAEKHNCSPLATSLLVPCPLQISMNRCKALTFLLLLKNCIRTHEPLSAHNANILSMTTISAMLTNILDRYQCEIASLLITLNGVQLSVSPFIHVVPHQLVQPAIKVFVVGNSLSGKTTLIEALKTGTILKRTLSGLFSWKRKVLQVQSSTSGIIPVHMQADDIGHIIMYDFAGHHEYYSSHAALMDTLAFSKGTMIIILLNLREDISKLVKTLEYWQSFIRNATYTKSKGPPVLVMGSHSDIVVSEGEDPSERLSLVLKKLKHPLCNVGVDLNCTLLSSEGLNKLKNVIKKYAKYSFEKYDMDLPKVNFLNIFVIKKHLSKCTACLVSSMMAMIKRREEFSILRECGLIPLTIDELSQTLTTLSECGQLLYLKNSQDVMKGWIILQPSFLLSQINGTIFSSSNRTISSETGIVHLSKIKELFRYRHQMIINLMTHLEFCHRISDSEVLLINKCLYSSVDSDASEVYYFFPALVEQERPIATWESMSNTHYRCGWCLRRRDRIQDQFLSPRFIHVLLLRLAILFGQNSDEGYKPQSISIHRECNVWRNGIHFQNMDGVATIVEVVEQNTAIVMVMGCLEGCELNCVRQRSELIQVILQTKEQFSGTVEMDELLIHPKELSTYPLKDSKHLLTFSINRLARAIVEQKKVITQQQGMEKIDTIVYLESYSNLTHKLISKLFDETDANSEIQDNILCDYARVMSQCVEIIQFKEILLTSVQKHELIRTTEHITVLRTWKKFSRNPTYKGLREVLDMYSVFRGRNILAKVIQAMDKEPSYSANQDTKEEENQTRATLEAIERQGELCHSTVHGVFIGSTRSGKYSLMERLLRKMPSASSKTSSSTGVTKRIVHVQVQKSCSMAEGLIWQKTDYDDVDNVPSLDLLKTAIESKDLQALQQHFGKILSLYLSITGGQIKFQDVLPLLVSGPCMFFYTFRLDRDLNECYEIHYKLPDGTTSDSCKSSMTTIEGIVQSLASIAAMGIFVYRGGQKRKVRLQPKVLFIGTHRDKLDNDLATDIIASIDHDLQKATGQFSDIIEFASKDQMMFAVNNFSQDDTAFREIHSAVEQIVKRHEFEMVSPSHWLIYSLALQRLKAEIVTYEECFEVAKQYGITDRIEHDEALHFIHTKMGLIRYFPSEHIKDLVIIQPQLLYDKISELIWKTFPFEEVGKTSAAEQLKHNGIFSFSDFERIHRESDSVSAMKPSQFVEFFKASHIAAPIEEEGGNRINKFFFPYILGYSREAQKQIEFSTLAVSPLVITFKYGYCPKGLGGVLINYLMTDEVNPKIRWKLLTDQIFRNQVSFKVGPLDTVILRILPTHLVLIYIPELEFQDQSTYCTENVCLEVKKTIDTGIRNVARSLNFIASEVEPSFTFLCPCVECENKYPAEMKFHDDRPVYLCCTKTRKNQQLPQGYDKWFTIKLTELHHPVLLQQLTKYASHWRTIGEGLRFTPYELDNIEAKPLLLQRAPTSWLSAVLAEWLQWTPGDSRGSKDFATFETLIFALNEAGLAAAANDLHL